MPYKVINTKSFSQTFKRFKKNQEFINALDKKIQRLKEDPNNIGGYLSGELHGYKSTRIIGKYRLIFEIDEKNNKVYLLAIDHRKFGYKRF